MRAALIVGVDEYTVLGALYGCVGDAVSVSTVLARHGDGRVNFDCRVELGRSDNRGMTRAELKDAVEDLFAKPAEIALFYFAGHGHVETTGGYLLTTDARRGDDGLALADVLALANRSLAQNKVVILDSCHSGIAGNAPITANLASLAEGLTVLTASTADQYATEENGHGVFTSLLVDALEGGAANLTGDITPGSVYAHIDQSLGAWQQRPVFKTNVRQFVSLRQVEPPIELADLRRLPQLFPTPDHRFSLDPSFEPEQKGRDAGMPPPDPENTKTFSILQRYNRLHLLEPVGAPHMWHAAMESKTCKLTVLGKHYHRLAERGRI